MSKLSNSLRKICGSAALLATLLGTTSCGQMLITRRAARLPVQEADCKITWEHGAALRMSELLQAGNVQVAYYSVRGSYPEYTDELKKLLRPDTCRLGGDRVLMTTLHGEGAAGTTSFEVFGPGSQQAPSAAPVTD